MREIPNMHEVVGNQLIKTSECLVLPDIIEDIIRMAIYRETPYATETIYIIIQNIYEIEYFDPTEHCGRRGSL